MLAVTQNKIVIAHFHALKDIYNHLCKMQYGFCSSIESYFSHDPNETYYNYASPAPTRIHCLVVYNVNGIRLSREHLVGEFRKFRKPVRYNYGSKRHHRSSYHRRPHTTQERACSTLVHRDECEPKWRAKRNCHSLPNSYDDVSHYDIYNRNWKRFRMTRYK
jgi:hypothetical protein